MSARWPWFERSFQFDFPVGKFPDLLSRLRGTPPRVEELVRGASDDRLCWHDTPGTWSIKQNIGHLVDLESLWQRRIEDFLHGEPRLSVADLTNAATHTGRFDEKAINDLLGSFRDARERTVKRLRSCSDADWARTSVHPRLNQPMRLIDAIAFTCDHDDYHLARIDELLITSGGL